MKDLARRIKDYFNKGGVRRPDFWLIITFGFSVFGILFEKISFVGIALLPAFLAGYYLAEDTWDEGPDDGGEGDSEISDLDPDDFKLYA